MADRPADTVREFRLEGAGLAVLGAFLIALVAGAFFVLAVVVTIGSVSALITSTAPDESPIGIAYLALTVVVMLSLGAAKRATGRRLRSEPLTAEAQMSIIDAALAFGVLIGLAANALFGWWWADPIAALLVAVVAIREGIENLEEASELSRPAT